MYIFDSGIQEVYTQSLSPEPWSPPGVSLLAARRMWSTAKGEGVVVAVIDTGVDYQHNDLASNIVGGKSFVSSEKDYMDNNGHGTHVAGTIAANGKILGVAPNAKILAVKVLNKDGMGSYSDIIQGISWARQWQGDKGERVNIINMSLGGPLPNQSLHRELAKVAADGIMVVCAAGNSGDGKDNTREISYPAYYSECLAVGAVDLDTRAANFSNSNDKIDVVAPGVDTYSTYPKNRYVKLSGTSMAAPHVSGALALIYSRYYMRFKRYPTLDYVRDYLHYQAIDLGKIGFDNLYGYGLFSFNIDGGKAIKLIIGSRNYYINGQLNKLGQEPFWENGSACISVEELCNLLSCDSNILLANSNSDSPEGQLEIWS
ncbi:MAG: S8 family peptidase [Syntrophomonadaceae bacterium]|jgi:major intracellular serine protease